MNYYIQGDAAKAEQIKAAFERLGYYTGVNGWNFNADCGVYFTNESDKTVEFTHIENFVNLIKTHPDYKELELPVEPKFKVGDKVIYCEKERTITFMDDHFYDFDGGCAGCRIEKQDELLSPAPKPHYDISNFHAGMPVLVRDGDREWRYVLFSHIGNGCFSFNAAGTVWQQCIPFNDDTKHLLGTTDMPSEEYINW